MTLDIALCFPETRPEPFSLRFLPLFFDSLLYFTPTGPSPESSATIEAKPLYSFRNPFADDEDSSRFDRLAEELAGKGREYYRHFLASLPQPGGSMGESSVASLISLFTGKKAGESQEMDEKREQQWHSRLFLLLSTLLGEEEADIARNLDSMAARKQRMLAALHGLGDQGSTNSGNRPAARPFYPEYSSQQLKNLLQAFACFFLAAPEAKEAVLCTAHSGVGDLLLELYEKQSRSTAIELAALILPAGPKAKAEVRHDHRISFRRDTATMREILLDLLENCATSATADQALRQQVRQAAASFNEDALKTARGNDAKLTMYLLPGMPLATLFSRTFPKTVAVESNPRQSSGLLAILTPV